MKPPDLWRILLDKASEDEYVVGKLIDLQDSPDDVVGFHLRWRRRENRRNAFQSTRVIW